MRRRTLLLIAVIGVAPAFAIVNGLVGAARAERQSIARDWAERGERDLASGRPLAAAEDFRTAREYARDRSQYRLQLAESLLSADRLPEARSRLQTLWSETPGDGRINLLLARIAARAGDLTDAIRHYHGAIDGAWSVDATGARRHARLELVRLLLSHGARAQAQAELTALSGDVPHDPQSAEEARIAGEVAFETGDYPSARRDLELARGRGGLDAEAEAMLDISARVLALDPYARGIRSREHVRRVVRAYEIAAAALARCQSKTPPALADQLAAMEPSVRAAALARDPDAVDETLRVTSDAIVAVADACGPGHADERALELVLRQRRADGK